MNMKAEQQYIDLFTQCEALICRHSAEGDILCSGFWIEPESVGVSGKSV